MNTTQRVPLGTAAPAAVPRTFVLRVNPRIAIFLFCILTSVITRNPGIGISVLALFWLCFGWPTQEPIVLMRVEY
jgi:energy-coupling factor transporter transmembrane protein EcfT